MKLMEMKTTTDNEIEETISSVKDNLKSLGHKLPDGGEKLKAYLRKNEDELERRKKVFSTWMTFRGNTRDLGSFGEETDKITDLHQIHKEVLFTDRGDGVAGIKRRRRDLSSDDVRDLATASGRGRLKEDLESST
ncbi:hypothetical protein Tco_0213051 [Tanacetum coccineum]